MKEVSGGHTVSGPVRETADGKWTNTGKGFATRQHEEVKKQQPVVRETKDLKEANMDLLKFKKITFKDNQARKPQETNGVKLKKDTGSVDAVMNHLHAPKLT